MSSRWRPTHVYVVTCPLLRLQKVGASRSPIDRLDGLRSEFARLLLVGTNSPAVRCLDLVKQWSCHDAAAVEIAAHGILQDDWYAQEWFDVTVDEATEVDPEFGTTR